MSQNQIHATCISIDGKGVLLLGPSGSGKSDLALRLIDGGAVLVADDRVDLVFSLSPLEGEGRGGGVSSKEDPLLRHPHPLAPSLKGRGKLLASAPEKLQGLLEMRGVGIMRLPYNGEIPLALAIQLVARDKVERLPETKVWDCLGLQLPLLSLYAFDASACARIRMFLLIQEKI